MIPTLCDRVLFQWVVFVRVSHSVAKGMAVKIMETESREVGRNCAKMFLVRVIYCWGLVLLQLFNRKKILANKAQLDRR